MAFEILGMLGQTLHIPNSCFRAVPNPTFYHWDKKYFNLRKLLREYKSKITDNDLIRYYSDQIHSLQVMAENVDKKLSQQRARSGENGISLELLDALHETLADCDTYLKTKVRRKVIEHVLREHAQEVLKLVNDEDGYEDAKTIDGDLISADDPNGKRKRLRYNDLMTASPEEKQERLMDIYFAVLMPKVAAQAATALKRVKVTTLNIPQLPSHNRHGSTSSLGSLVRNATPQAEKAARSRPNPAGRRGETAAAAAGGAASASDYRAAGDRGVVLAGAAHALLAVAARLPQQGRAEVQERASGQQTAVYIA